MASIIDEILNGVIPFTDNQALSSLAQIFGKKMLNEGADIGSLVQLSAALNPVYLGLLFIILAYIGIGGVVRTAMDGSFLGRQWSSFGVPAMFMCCVVLLSPVPSKGAASLGQVLFIKAVVFGSNFADYTLKTTFVLAGQETYVKESYSLIPQYIPGVNNQMRGAFLTYYCGRQITQMGYGSKVDYFVLLNKVCGVPADMTGLYNNFYMLDPQKGHVGAMQARANSFKMEGMDVPEFLGYETTTIVASSQNLSPTSKQMLCHYKQFDASFSVPAIESVRTAGNITPLPGIPKVTGPNGSEGSKPTQVNSRLLKLNEPALAGMWGKALYDAYGCLQREVYQGKLLEESGAQPAGTPNNAPWRLGWTNAALAISEELSDYKSTQKGYTIPLSVDVVQRPNAELLGETLLDKKNRTLLNDELLKLDQFLTGVNNPIDKSQEVIMDITSKGYVATTADWGRVATTVFFANGVKHANDALSSAAEAQARITNGAALVGDQATVKKGERIQRFMNTLVGKSTSVTATGLGKTTSLAGKTILWMSNKLGLLMKKDKAAASLSNIPVVGWVTGVVNAAADVLGPHPAVMEVASYLLVIMNAIVLLPQLVLVVVMLIWLVKAAVWFMIIPLATVLIALPNTRVGHDIWKSALAIALTPVLALVFYLISLTVTDQMYLTVMYWVFQPIIYQWDSSSGVGGTIAAVGFEVFMQILTGEIFFRVILGITLAGATTVYLTMLVLRGPDLVCRALGLSSSSGDLGEGFEEMRGGIRGKLAGSMGRGG